MAAPQNDRRFRIGVRVLKGEIAKGQTTLVKATIGALKEKSSLVGGSEPAWNFACAFEVMDYTKDLLTLTVEKGSSSGVSFLSRDIVGSVDVHVKDFLWTPGSPYPQPKQFELKHFDGVKTTGKITAQIILVEAPAKTVPIKCLVGTWNVGNEPPAADLKPWLKTEQGNHELVAIGAQECTYKERSGFKDCESDWVGSLEAALGPDYVRLRSDTLGQMRLVLFARLDVFPAIHGHESMSEATGVGHVGSNKGGVASYVWVWDTSVCFVNSHLAAHQGKTARRNSDYREIVEQISLGDVGLDILHQFHHTVWMGDLNYRLDLGEVFGPSANAKTPPKEVFDKIQEMCAKGDTAEMLKCDQLRKSIAENKGFVGFKEGDITHLPTFKVKREKGFVYNTQRSPAYCDRILWRSLPGLSAKQTGLWCAPEVETSDHKPVACTLELDRHQSRPRWLPRKAKNVLAGQVRRSQAHHMPDDNVAVPTWELQLTALAGADLMSADYTGKSDPYVIFFGDALMQPAHTDYETQTLQPKWNPKRLPKVTVFAASEEAMMNEHIQIVVMDYDATSPDDPIGNGVLSMRTLLQTAKANNGVATFDVYLMHAGVMKGQLMGTMTIKQGPKTTVHAIRHRKPAKIAPSKEFSLARLFGFGPKAPAQPAAPPSNDRVSVASTVDDDDDDDEEEGGSIVRPGKSLAAKSGYNPGNAAPEKPTEATDALATAPVGAGKA